MLDLEQLNRRHGTDLRFAGRYDGGEFGAIRLVDGVGRRFVLKQQPPGRAAITTERLRALGYPAPRYLVWGAEYQVQEELPGVPAGGWGAAALPIMSRLLELSELQAGRAVDDDSSWPRPIVESVLVGFSDYAVIGTLEGHSSESRELLLLCQRVVDRHASGIRPCRDIVHWDFTLANVLVDEERVTGVIDWGGTRSGDRLFDLATLVYYARGQAHDIAQYVVERIGDDGLAVYLAHMAVRQSDWSLRHHGAAAGEDVLRYSLELARGFG